MIMNMKRIFMAAVALLLCVAFNDADASGRKKKDFSVEHPWAGAKVAYLGDSITDPGVLKEDTHYWGFLQQWLDIEPLVYGRSGHQWHQIAGQADKLNAEHGDDFDAIMIFVGTNDYNAGVPIGIEENLTSYTAQENMGRVRVRELKERLDSESACVILENAIAMINRG